MLEALSLQIRKVNPQMYRKGLQQRNAQMCHQGSQTRRCFARIKNVLNALSPVGNWGGSWKFSGIATDSSLSTESNFRVQSRRKILGNPSSDDGTWNIPSVISLHFWKSLGLQLTLTHLQSETGSLWGVLTTFGSVLKHLKGPVSFQQQNLLQEKHLLELHWSGKGWW